MPRPPSSTSAYESFPAHEFDAWIDRLRHTIIDGLEEPEFEVAEVAVPTLSNGALEAVKQAEREAAEAEAKAQAEAQKREEEARAAAQQQLEHQRQMLAHLQQRKQQLEDERQQAERRNRERQELEQQRQEYVRRQQEAEERERLQASREDVAAQEEEYDEDAEYENDSGEHVEADQDEQEAIAVGVSEDGQGGPYGDFLNNDQTDAREDDLFGDEDEEDDEQPQFPASPRSQAVDQEEFEEGTEQEIIDEEEEGMEIMETDGRGPVGDDSLERDQSEDDDDQGSVSEQEAPPLQGYRRTYTSMQTDDHQGSDSQEGEYDEGEYEEGEEYDDDGRASPGSDQGQTGYDENGEEDVGSEEGEQLGSRYPAQTASSNQLHGNEDDAIEVIDDSDDEDNEQSRRDESASQESGEEEEGYPQARRYKEASDENALSEAESGQERSERGQDEEYSQGEYEERNEDQSRQHVDLHISHRPSEYDMDEDEDETGAGYESDDEGVAGGADMQDQPIEAEYEDQDQRNDSRESSEDELAEDEQGEIATRYDAYQQPERQLRMVQPPSELEEALAIDPALDSGHVQVAQAQQMVQVSSRGLVVDGMLQMAYTTQSGTRTFQGVFPLDAAEPATSVTQQAEPDFAQVDPEAFEESTPRDGTSPLNGPEVNQADAQFEMELDITEEGNELPDPVPEAPESVEMALSDAASVPEDTQSATPPGSQGLLPTSAFTEYEADDELQLEEGPSAAPSISTFDAIFANTPEAHVSDVVDATAEEEESHPIDPNPAENITVAAGSTKEPDAQAAHPTATSEIYHTTAASVASSKENMDRAQGEEAVGSPPAIALSQEETASDGAQMDAQEQHDAESSGSDRAYNDDDGDAEMDVIDRSREQHDILSELADNDHSHISSPGSDREASEMSLSQPEEIPARHEPNAKSEQQRPETFEFDGSADFVRLKTPPDGEDSELEDGEIRDDDELVVQEREASPMSEANEDAGPSNQSSRAEDDDRIGSDVEVRDDVDVDAQSDDQAEDPEEEDDEQASDVESDTDEGSPENLPDTENSDGIRRGPAEVMGSGLEGVRVDEIATIEEDDEDSPSKPDYDRDSSKSAEVIQYDSDDALPRPMEPEPEVTEADPDDPRALIKEIRRHDLKDIPHKAEHLLEEDETYDVDSPAHHMDDIPAGYKNYPVVDETNSHDMEIFEMAEREHAGIEGDRTTEQMMIEEMELRHQPGDPTRGLPESQRSGDHAAKSGRGDEIMPRQPSVDQIRDGVAPEDSSVDLAKGEDVPPVQIAQSAQISGPVSRQGSSPDADQPISSEDGPSAITDGHEAESISSADRHESNEQPLKEPDAENEDMFAVDPVPTAEANHGHAAHASIVDLLNPTELPQAPLHDRSPSPLAPEEELEHDAALAMEPAPLLHRHDHHQNVVLEESHRIHEEKLQSFTSAIAAVQESPSSRVIPASTSQENTTASDSYERVEENTRASDSNERVDLGSSDDCVTVSQDNGTVDDKLSLPPPPPLESERMEDEEDDEHQDDDDDPLRLSGPFDDHDSVSSPGISGTQVYVELPIIDRSVLRGSNQNSDVDIDLEQWFARPTTPIHPPTSAADPTRHHHGPNHITSVSAIRNGDLEISGSPAAHTRSQCHYHKIRFGRGVFSHVLLIPHCSIGTESVRQHMGASDLGRVTKEEMQRKRDLNLGETFTTKMTSDVETLPDDLEHQVKQLAGPELLREGHIWLLPLADVAPQSMVNRTLQNPEEQQQEDDVFHIRSSPRVSSRAPSQTPDRKRKRGSSRARSTSATRSEGDSPDSASKGTRSRSRAGIVRKVSQIEEKDEETQEATEARQPENVVEHMDDEPIEGASSQQDDQLPVEGEVKQEPVESPTDSDVASDQARPEKRANDDSDDDEDEEVDGRASKKRIIERDDGEGRDAVDVKPPQKTGWLSWFFGKR